MEKKFTRQEFVALLKEHGLNEMEAGHIWDTRPSDMLDPEHLIASVKRTLPLAKILREKGISK